jgi:23S rRNA pseudouridine1911/1915/1917 synthase
MPKPFTVAEPTPLLASLFAAWPELKKKQVRTWLKHKSVLVNGRPVSQFDHPLKSGDKVAIRSENTVVTEAELPSGIKVWHEDAALLVIEKPAGLLSMASEAERDKTAYAMLTSHVRKGNRQGRERVWIVHRLDRDTSGLMVFAKTESAKRALQKSWDRAEKKYQAVIEGALPQEKGVFESYLDESNPLKVYVTQAGAQFRRAITRYRVLKKGTSRSLVELTLDTGRRHQIRVQLAEAGHPIAGDGKYGAKTDPARRVALHACMLSFPHPVTGKTMRFESVLPKELARLV